MKTKFCYTFLLILLTMTISSCYHRPCDAYSYEKNVAEDVTFDTLWLYI